MKEAINFLTHVYDSSVADVAHILVSEAEGDTDVIVMYLEHVRDFVNRLIEDTKREGEGGRNLSADIAQDHDPSFAPARSDFEGQNPKQ